MHLKSDVLVIGAGIAGLTAALAAKAQNCKVALVGAGSGSYAISSGCIDLLGQVHGSIIDDPWAHFADLPENHPYRILGTDIIQEALSFFQEILNRHGCMTHIAKNDEGKPCNSFLPTILGTFKPSYLIPDTSDIAPLAQAQTVLLCGIEGFRDMSAKLMQENFLRHPALQKKRIDIAHLPNPMAHAHRSLSALDIARFANSPQGFDWLKTALGRYKEVYDIILLPPICGISHAQKNIQELRKLLHCHIAEILAIPPGVGGLRLHDILLEEARSAHISIVENATITNAEVRNHFCLQVKSANTSLSFSAKAYVLATGGLFGGGFTLTPYSCTEKIFQIPIPLEQEELTEADIFGEHKIARIGVMAEKTLRPMGHNGNTLLENVFLAGKSLANFDHASEKSGHGVAISTGYYAGLLASKAAQETRRG